ncbi:MAG: PrgI family protein, partial [Nanoarchaeota archaeon]
MENHPIPQDVTGFKFRLIGSVTVKQFLYLLGFGILTTVAFILPINILLKIPMMVVFALIGISLAFVPIEGRPMDIMLINFAKAIPSENRYIYRKRGVNLASFQIFYATPQEQAAPRYGETKAESTQDEKKAILLSRLRNSPFRPDEGELQHLASVRSLFADKEQPSGPEAAL